MNWSYIWPSFFWKLMSDNTKYLSDIWKWIPQNWRLMWIDSLVDFQADLEEFSVSFFTDISLQLQQLKEDLAAMTLLRLKNSLNRHPYCSVKCPWGCDEFPEVCHHLPYYGFIIMNLLESFPDIQLPLSSDSIVYGDNKKFSFKNKLVGIRPDYLTTVNFLLDNPEWPILPSISFIFEFTARYEESFEIFNGKSAISVCDWRREVKNVIRC